MSGHKWADQYEAAMLRLRGHVHRTDDGTFELDITDGKSIGIEDPIVFANLKRSLEETNKKIKRREIDPDLITEL